MTRAPQPVLIAVVVFLIGLAAFGLYSGLSNALGRDRGFETNKAADASAEAGVADAKPMDPNAALPEEPPAPADEKTDEEKAKEAQALADKAKADKDEADKAKASQAKAAAAPPPPPAPPPPAEPPPPTPGAPADATGDQVLY